MIMTPLATRQKELHTENVTMFFDILEKNYALLETSKVRVFQTEVDYSAHPR